jgi:hypothetical protein
MIIQLDKYRKASAEVSAETYESRRWFGNTMPKLRIADIQYEARRSAGPRLPDDFAGINTREMLLDAYSLATQI